MLREHPVVKRRRRILIWFLPALLVVGYAGFVALRLFLLQPRLEVGRETTFVEGPLRADGTVDFAAALNEEWSKGVTPENNAAVLLARAFGPGVVAPEIREEYFDLLGIEPPAEGEYFVTLVDYLVEEEVDQERRRELTEAYVTATGREIAESYPELIGWVERNERPMEHVIAASRREQFFLPMLPPTPSGPLMTVSLATHQQCREVARLCRVRSQLRLELGEVDEARDDALMCHRLGRLVARHPALICYLVGMSVDAFGAEISQAIVLSGQLTPESAKRLREGVEALPPFPELADVVDRGDRLASLDMLFGIVDQPEEKSDSLFFGLTPKLDPNVVLRDANTMYDAWVATLRGDDRGLRTAKVDELVNELRRAVERKPNRTAALKAALAGDPAGYTRQISATLVSLMFPAIRQTQEGIERARMRTLLVRLGAALAEYRAIEGEFPETLEALRPDYVDAIPEDTYSGEPLVYQRVEGGFLLYSFGPNGLDDGGWGLSECEEGPDACDDVRFGVDPIAMNGSASAGKGAR